MIISINEMSEIPIYQQIRNQIVQGISDGRLSPGEQLPTVRGLAEEIGINSMTVNKAYSLLKQEGYIFADRRSGARVRKEFAVTKELSEKSKELLQQIISEAKVSGMTKKEFFEICEQDLCLMMKQVEEACAKANVQVMGGHTEVTRVVNQPVISVCGVGKVKKGHLISTAGARPGMDILVSKWIGIEGTSIITKEKEEELKTHFAVPFIEKAKALDAYISVQSEAAVAVTSGVSAMHDVTEGGIFGALWEMAEASGVGLEIDLKKIPIRQETVEVCEFFGVNPYLLISSGCMLMAAQDGNHLVRELEKAGIKATIIGKATAGNDRVLLNEDERRFLEPPKTDELYKVIGR